MNNPMNLSIDDVLATMGLRQQRSNELTDTVLPALAVFSAGVVLGATTALLLAPKAGRELRHDIQDRALDLKDRVQSAVPALPTFNHKEADAVNGLAK
jgi:hypothetical protein